MSTTQTDPSRRSQAEADQLVNKKSLEGMIKDVYRDVAEKPKAQYHFEMGRSLAEKLGYPPEILDRIPTEAIDSFAGVGYHFGLANLKEGETVLDLGSGSGMDVFFAALDVGLSGKIIGVDMTDKQLEKSERLKNEGNFANVSSVKSYIEKIDQPSESVDVVISNGVINLSAEKDKVFAEIARILKPGGRLAISDIISSKPLSERIKSSADLWASCIGGAIPEENYKGLIESVGLKIQKIQDNPQYHFLTHQDVMEKYGIKSISLVAVK